MGQDRIAVIIPSLEPGKQMLELVKRLVTEGYQNIILINDGSNSSYDALFQQVDQLQGVKVLKHAVNLGKGRALKTAFNYILTQCGDCIGAVTIDADGQHRFVDMEACIQCFYEHPKALVLGCRNFQTSGIPFRSRLGNRATCLMLKLLCGIQVRDTQTGLRVFSRTLMKAFLNVPGERFEYEMNMILYTKDHQIELQQVDIETIYVEQNESSHFRPFIDSARIYGMFFKFILSSVWSFMIDIAIFTIMVMLLKPMSVPFYIVIATVVARAISAICNFSINKNRVFQANEKTNSVALKYVVLCITQLALSAFFVSEIFLWIHINESILKILVDTCLFVLSFQIQRDWVFRKETRT